VVKSTSAAVPLTDQPSVGANMGQFLVSTNKHIQNHPSHALISVP
jgi:hypothetical protein